MKNIFRLFIAVICSYSALANALATGNISVTGTIDNPGDVDVYAYTLNAANGNDPQVLGGQNRVMIRMASPNHSVQVLTAYNATTQAETWATAANGDGAAYIIFADPGSTQYFRVVNIAATNDPNLQYKLYLSNPPHTSLGGNISSSDGLSYTPWTFFGIEARTSITFSGTMVDQYYAPVPFSPQVLSLGHASGKIIRQIQADAAGWYSYVLTFPRCTGGGMILGAAANTPVGTNYPERTPTPNYFYSDNVPWYSAWPMLDSFVSPSDPFGMQPYGPSPGVLQAGAFGFNQDCN
jgi:hypothetical protein